jgi:23S rRNA pseudouridine955/2504/2580 synthase
VPILNDIKKTGKMYASKDGKPATTKFKLLSNYGKISLMAFFPVTGRTHQIRVHSKYINCPLLIDELYAGKNAFYLSEIKRNYQTNDFEDEKPFIHRLTLHAKSIKFQLANGQEVFFESELPKELKALKNQLDKLLKK